MILGVAVCSQSINIHQYCADLHGVLSNNDINLATNVASTTHTAAQLVQPWKLQDRQVATAVTSDAACVLQVLLYRPPAVTSRDTAPANAGTDVPTWVN